MIMANVNRLALLSLITLQVTGQYCPCSLKSPPPPMLRCGAQKDATKRGSMFTPTTVDSVEDCANSCDYSPSMGTGTCQSFTYNSDTSACVLFGKAGPRLGLKPSVDGTRFYNIGCFTYTYQPVDSTDTFVIQISDSADSTIIGDYFQATTGNQNGPQNIDIFDNSPSRFRLEGSTLMDVDTGNSVYYTGGTQGQYAQGLLYFDTSANAEGDELLDCQVDPCSQALTCSVSEGNTIYGCDGDGGYVSLVTNNDPNNCYVTEVKVADIQKSAAS